MSRVLIVGAALAGLRTAQALRRHGFDGDISLIGQEQHLPYDRPPLSKQVLTGQAEPASVAYAGADELEAAGICFEPGLTAVQLTPTARTVALSNGHTRRYEELVIATGARAVQPFPDAPAGVFTLRTLDDALALRAAMHQARRLVVVGAGFIGLEVASSARALGLDVTVIESAPQPLARSLGREPATAVASLATAAGVQIVCEQTVTGFTGDDQVTAVTLAGGRSIPADVVLIGVGAVPNTEWLTGSGAQVTGAGLACSSAGHVAQLEHVWALGDVAAWTDPNGQPRRREHWTSAVEQANVVAANIVDAGSRTLTAADYVWSEQFDQKVSLIGDTTAYDEMQTLEASPERLAVLYARQGQLTGACIVGQMPLVLKCRRWVAAATPLDELDIWQRAA